MDLSLRLILSLVGVLIVVSILLDGLRRLRHIDEGRKREKREAAINSYVAPTIREKPDSDEIVGPVRVVKTEPRMGRFSSKVESDEEFEDESSINTEDARVTIPKEQFYVINITSKTREGFAGSELVPAFLAAGLRFGEMGIFHRHEHVNGQGKLLFSVASLVEPGTFDIDNVDNFTVPGLTFFMCLPGPANPISTYNMMIQTAKRIAETMDGELRDRAKNLLTPHAILEQQKQIREWMKQHVGALATSE
jgi:cell division protein ZipA